MDSRITHVVINVSDMRKSTMFYDKVFRFLGLKKIYSNKHDTAYWNSMFSFWLHKRKKTSYSMERTGYHHIAISANSRRQVNMMQELFDENKFRILYRAQEHPEFQRGYYSMSFKDPDGIVIELLYLPKGVGYG